MLETERRSSFTTSNFVPLENSVRPNEGGRFIPNFDPNDYSVDARPVIPNSPLLEAQKPQSQPIELAPDLKINFIPKWDSLMELNRFVNHINIRVSESFTMEDAVIESAQELEMNIRAYDNEIIKSKAVLVHVNRFDYVDGVLRMVGNDGEPVVNAISDVERRGSVLDASIAIENSLLKAKNNSFSVLMNPAEWNGYVGPHGEELEHLNAEPMVFWKSPEGKLKGLTFHVDLSLDQAEAVMVSLGIAKEDLEGKSKKDRIVNIVRNPALGLSLPESYANPFEYVLDKILAERGQRDFRLLQHGAKPEIRSIESVRADIKRFDTLLKGSEEEEKLLTDLKTLILGSTGDIGQKDIQQQIIKKMEGTLLRLTRIHLQEIGAISASKSDINIVLDISKTLNKSDDDFAKEIAFLKTRAGCLTSVAIAMVLAGISLGSGGFVTSGVVVESDKYGSLEFACPSCKRVNKRTKGKLMSSCKHCGSDVSC